MASLIESITGVNFVDLKVKSARKIFISNTYSKSIYVNIVLGDKDIAGSSTIGANAGAYLLKEVRIPTNTTLYLSDIGVTRITTTPGSSTIVDDSTILISLKTAAETADVFVAA